MNDEKVCDLFYKEYRAGSEEAEGIYRRYQFAVVTIALVAGVVSAVTRHDLLPLFWLRIDVFLYYVFAGLAGLLLFSASICLVASIYPRKFQHLDRLEKWRAWRAGYRQEVIDSGYGDGDAAAVDAAVASATCEQAIERLAQAADWNAERMRDKVGWFHYSFYLTAAAIGALTIQAVFHAILYLGHVKVPNHEQAQQQAVVTPSEPAQADPTSPGQPSRATGIAAPAGPKAGTTEPGVGAEPR